MPHSSWQLLRARGDDVWKLLTLVPNIIKLVITSGAAATGVVLMFALRHGQVKNTTTGVGRRKSDQNVSITAISIAHSQDTIAVERTAKPNEAAVRTSTCLPQATKTPTGVVQLANHANTVNIRLQGVLVEVALQMQSVQTVHVDGTK